MRTWHSGRELRDYYARQLDYALLLPVHTRQPIMLMPIRSQICCFAPLFDTLRRGKEKMLRLRRRAPRRHVTAATATRRRLMRYDMLMLYAGEMIQLCVRQDAMLMSCLYVYERRHDAAIRLITRAAPCFISFFGAS